MLKIFSKLFKKKEVTIEPKEEETIVEDEVAANEVEEPQLPMLISKATEDGVKMRHNVNEMSFNTNALIIDCILMDMINKVGVKQYNLEDKKYVKYALGTDVNTYVIYSKHIDSLLDSTPMTKCCIMTKYGTMFPVSSILSYYWWVLTKDKNVNDMDVDTLMYLYTKCYIETLNCIQVNDPNASFVEDMKAQVYNVAQMISTSKYPTYITELPYVNKVIKNYNKSTDVYIKTRVSKYKFTNETLNESLKSAGISLAQFVAHIMFISLSKDMPTVVNVNKHKSLELLGKVIAYMFMSIL